MRIPGLNYCVNFFSNTKLLSSAVIDVTDRSYSCHSTHFQLIDDEMITRLITEHLLAFDTWQVLGTHHCSITGESTKSTQVQSDIIEMLF